MRLRAVLVIGLFWLCICPVLQGQGSLPVVPPKAKKLYEKATLALEVNALDKASVFLEDALKIAPDYYDAWVQLGNIRHDQGQLETALSCYERALSIHPSYRPVVWYLAAATCAKLMRFEAAIPKLEAYLQYHPKNERQKYLAEALLRQARFAAQAVRHPVPFNPTPLDASINTAFPEYLPSLSADASYLVFTRVVDGQEDFFSSARTEASGWQLAQPIHSLNTPGNEGAHCLSADGQALLFTACNYPGGMGSCDLYISYRDGHTWTVPANMGIPINTTGYETQPTLSADGNTLIFTSTRPGGFGKNDLWQSIRQPDGKWSTPVNMGSLLNTPEDDQAPFLHPDGQTLYFMSTGHPGMGNFDLFLSRKDTQGNWQTPINLGYPINSHGHEGALTVRTDGLKAYFTKAPLSSGNTRFPNTDIFEFDLYPEARPLPVTYAKGIIRDATTKQPLQANVRIQDTETGQPLAQLFSKKDGTFLVCLPLGKNYALLVQQENYVFYSEHFALAQQADTLRPYTLEVALQPIEQPTHPSDTASVPIVLRNVFFASGSAELLSNSQAELQLLFQLLQRNPKMRILIGGHTDDVGGDIENQLLSERRAKAVHDYLITQGISKERLSFRGYGENMPIVPNTTPENRQRNRRTEFTRIN